MTQRSSFKPELSNWTQLITAVAQNKFYCM